jgi:hypothetical protein
MTDTMKEKIASKFAESFLWDFEAREECESLQNCKHMNSAQTLWLVD